MAMETSVLWLGEILHHFGWLNKVEHHGRNHLSPAAGILEIRSQLVATAQRLSEHRGRHGRPQVPWTPGGYTGVSREVSNCKDTEDRTV